MNRRELLRNAALAASAATVAGVSSRKAQAALPSASVEPPSPADGPSWLLQPLTVGSAVAFGWTLGLVETADRGAWILNLHHSSGEGARVHVCYHQGAPKGIAHTELLDLILMDGGDGDQPTTESLGRVLRHLSNIMARNELRPEVQDELAHLMTHAERVDAFGPETLL